MTSHDGDTRTIQTLRAAMDAQVRGHQLPPHIAEHARQRLGPVRRRPRRRVVAVVAVAVGVVAIIAAAVSYATVTGGGTHRQHPAGHPTAHNPKAPSSLSSATAPAAGVTAGQLARYRWAWLPTAPIRGRVGPAAVWTGTEMIVWGGTTDNGRALADGAAYNPATRRWSVLPRSPLSGRFAPATAYAGDVMFIWGGQIGGDGSGRARDGALYDPATRHWSLLPTAPVGDYSWAQALWSGGKVILLTTPPGKHVTVVHAAAFDPGTGKWTTLPDLHLKARYPILFATAVSAQHRVYVWAHWSRTVQISRNRYEGFSGIGGFSLDPSANRWTSTKTVPDQHQSVNQPLWTGRYLVLPASGLYCGTCTGGGPANNLHGYLVNPDTGAATALPHGPADDLEPQYLWTGDALLAYNTITSIGGRAAPKQHRPGEAAAWNPTTNRWITLHRAPLAGDAPVAVWTGTSLIEWGAMYQFEAPYRRQGTIGLQFGPP